MVDKDIDKVNEAAGRLAEAILSSYEIAVESGAAVQESNIRLARNIFERNIEALEIQAEINRQTLQSVAEQARKHQELFQELSQESLDAYDGFLGSLFTYYREAAPGYEEAGG